MGLFPISGRGIIVRYVRKYPADRRGLSAGDGQGPAARRRRPFAAGAGAASHTPIEPELASVMALGACPLTLSASELRRVADVMLQYGFLHRKLAVSPMILPEPQ
jgi:NitT/TauT family transport system substrate-binding protein